MAAQEVIYFITGNKHKFAEAKAIIPELGHLDIDLPELQEIDDRKVIEYKIKTAFDHHAGPFIVEDGSLYFDVLHELPGPFIKWFIKSLGLDQLAAIPAALGNIRGRAVVMLGYAANRDEVQYFNGEVAGTIVAPRGRKDFGYDPIFQPDGFDKTYGEMTPEEMKSVRPRNIAFGKLCNFLLHSEK